MQSVWNALKWQRFLLDWLTLPGEGGVKNKIVTKIAVTFHKNATRFNTLINDAVSQEYSGGGMTFHSLRSLGYYDLECMHWSIYHL